MCTDRVSTMASGWQRLASLQEEATSWLAANTPASTAALFNGFTRILQRRATEMYDLVVPVNEALIEMSLCMSHSQLGMPLPLTNPDGGNSDDCVCACASLAGLNVQKAMLSGSARENCSVSLHGSCSSDVDVMLQLGGVRVEDRPPDRPRKVEDGPPDQLRKVEDGPADRRGKAEDAPPDRQATFDFPAEDNPGRWTDPCGASQPPVPPSEAYDPGATGDATESCLEPVVCSGGRGAAGHEAGACAGQPETSAMSAASGKPQPAAADAGVAEELVVTMEWTDQPGFFLLRHRRRPSCRHPHPLPLSARRVVQMIDCLRECVTRRPPSYSGPAVSATVPDFSHTDRDVDLVACVRCPWWPSGDYASRERRARWPDAALVARLCRTAAFLVPVGFSGSVTEFLQWRLSFSRHEYIALRALTADQRMCLTALKYCRAVIGEAAKPLKSYYLKTALFWLAESRPADQWTPDTLHDSLLLMLRYVDVCLARGYLPCYFWPEVNLLAGCDTAARGAVAAAVAQLRDRLLTAVLALLADWLGRLVPELAERLLVRGQPLSSEQFWQMTVVSAVTQTLTRPVSGRLSTPTAADGDSDSDDSSDSSSDTPLMDAVLNLVTFGRNQTAGSLITHHPFFPGMSLSRSILEQLGEREDASSLLGILSMFQRGEGIARDSWLEED